MPLQATSGAASYDAFGGGVAAVPNYIEECFSTFLYQGNGSTQTINNGIDLAGKGGLVWIKDRVGAYSHNLVESARGVNNYLFSDLTSAQFDAGSLRVSSFNADGFSLGSGSNGTNRSGNGHVSWTFRKQPKFFDVVTYTGTNGVQTINHSLGSAPGCIIVKSTSTASQWNVYHRSLGATQALKLQATFAASSSVNFWNDTEPTATQFTLGASFNTLGETYVAYLFAHDAGGFGLTGTDNVISCGSFTTDGSGNATVSLGYEPQWLLVKGSSGETNWLMADNMRGWSETNIQRLFADASNADSNYTANAGQSPTATGFKFTAGLLSNSTTYIYIAIRRGPMKVPSTGSSVFAVADSAASFPLTLNSNFKVDAILGQQKTTNVGLLAASLTQRAMPTYQQFNESDFGGVGSGWTWDKQTGLIVTDWGGAGNVVSYCLGRAPSFMDVVCYTGTGSATTQAHNLGVVPELIIVKCRSVGNAWAIYSSALGNTKYLVLNTTAAAATGATWWNSTTPTSSVFSIGTTGQVNTSAATYVAYLFATCAGVSKVGSYTGTGTTLQIDCGFTAGARFIYIKRTDATGGWHVWDSARGIISGNDPYFLTNSTNAQVTGTDYIDPYSAGFEISSTAPAEINASGGTFIFLAIA